jgi:hypothetical protein
MPLSVDECEDAAAKLIEHNHPYTAIRVPAGCISEEGGPSPQLVATALESAVRTSPVEDADWRTLSYHVAELLDLLETSSAIEDGRVAALEWAFLPLLERRRRSPRTLHRELTRSPSFFTEVVAWVYRAEDDSDCEPSEEEHIRAQLGSKLLRSWRSVPGLQEDGSLDTEALQDWVGKALEATAADARRGIGEYLIGRVLSFGPEGSDGAWPAIAIRDLIEEIGSSEMEQGFETGVYNSRGAVWRSPFAGGEQERQIAGRYSRYARMISGQWPRTAAMLRRLADMYRYEARGEDVEAELREDLWQ